MMFATLFTLTQSMSRNLVEMTFRQTGYNAQASMRGLTEEQADLIAGHPDVAELGRSIVLGLAENQQLTGQSVEIRWANDAYARHSYAAPTTGPRRRMRSHWIPASWTVWASPMSWGRP